MTRSADVRASQKKGLRAVWCGIAGLYVFLFGIGGCQHSRWETRAQAAKIVTHYHPWVAVIGAIVAVVGFVIAKREKDRFSVND
jgi:hypothetical protein